MSSRKTSKRVAAQAQPANDRPFLAPAPKGKESDAFRRGRQMGEEFAEQFAFDEVTDAILGMRSGIASRLEEKAAKAQEVVNLINRAQSALQ